MDNMEAKKSREELLKEIMALDFAIIDLNLYLDTHPWNQRALMLYNHYAQRSMMLRNYYQNMYGPLTMGTFTSRHPWQWVEEPWPWSISPEGGSDNVDL